MLPYNYKLAPWQIIVVLFAVILFSATIFFSLFSSSGYHSPDYKSHAYLTSYYTDYIKAHLIPPNTIQVFGNMNFVYEDVNNVFPVYYCHLMYSFTALFNIVFGKIVGMNIFFSVITGVCFLVWNKILYLSTKSLSISIACAAAVTYSTYNLQNIYIRGAMGEYFATISLSIAAGLLFLIVLYKNEYASHANKKYYCLAGVTLFSIFASTHPITMLYGYSLLLIISLVVARDYFSRNTWRTDIGVALICITLVVVYNSAFLLSFIYTGRELAIPVQFILFGPDVRFDLIDALWVRIFPLPLDARTFFADLSTVRNPFLDTQISVPCFTIFICIIVSLITSKRRAKFNASHKYILPYLLASVLLLAMSAALIYFSVGKITNFENTIFGKLQFKYRMITYINILLVSSMVAFCLACKPLRYKFTTTTLCTLVATIMLMACGYFIFYMQYGLRPQTSWRSDFKQASWPYTQFDINFFYGVGAYDMPGLEGHWDNPDKAGSLGLPVVTLSFKPGAAPGKISNENLALDAKSVVFTNCSSHLWNKLELRDLNSGKKITIGDGRYISYVPNNSRCMRIAFICDPGNYAVKAKFSPPRIWKVLNFFRNFIPFALMAFIIVMPLVNACRRLKRRLSHRRLLNA